jgi:hypothetical protein
MGINEKLKTTLNVTTLISSLSLIGISTACLYLTSRSMKLVDFYWPARDLYVHKYSIWHGKDLPTTEVRRHNSLQYDSTNEGMIFAGATLGLIAGIVGLFGTFFTWKVSCSLNAQLNNPLTLPQSPKNTNVTKSTLYFLVLPSTVAFIGTLISLIFTTVIRETNNRGLCYWGESGSIRDNKFTCTRELAVCRIVKYFDRTETHMGWAAKGFWELCPQAETARHLIAGLFAVALLMFSSGLAKMVLARKGENAYVETADDRVERLQREEQ